MKNENLIKFFKIVGKGLKATVRFFLLVILETLESSPKKKKYEPTIDELMCGQRILGSDEYFIPNKKSHK